MKTEQLGNEPKREIVSPENLDYLLFVALNSIKEMKPENKSIVVAGVFDPETQNYFIAASRNVDTDNSYGKWNHAEYEAMALALKNQVDLSKAMLITSLGPCVIDGKNRAHRACTELIAEAGIKRVHIGVLDDRQADVEYYESKGLKVSVSKNPKLTEVCEGLNNYFNPKKEERLVGLDKAAYIDEILKNLPKEWNKLD